MTGPLFVPLRPPTDWAVALEFLDGLDPRHWGYFLAAIDGVGLVRSPVDAARELYTLRGSRSERIRGRMDELRKRLPRHPLTPRGDEAELLSESSYEQLMKPVFRACGCRCGTDVRELLRHAASASVEVRVIDPYLYSDNQAAALDQFVAWLHECAPKCSVELVGFVDRDKNSRKVGRSEKEAHEQVARIAARHGHEIRARTRTWTTEDKAKVKDGQARQHDRFVQFRPVIDRAGHAVAVGRGVVAFGEPVKESDEHTDPDTVVARVDWASAERAYERMRSGAGVRDFGADGSTND